MTAPDLILVPTDLSEASKPAWLQACHMAERFGSRLLLAHICETKVAAGLYPPLGFGGGDTFETEWLAAVKESVAEWSAEAPIAADRIESHVEMAPTAAPAILALAEDKSASMIVMGTHGHRGFRHFLLGSTAAEVVSHAPCSVLTLRSDHKPSAKPFSKVLGAVDLSAGTPAVAKAVAEQAKLYDASAHLVYVQVPLVAAYGEYTSGTLAALDLPSAEQLVFTMGEWIEAAGCKIEDFERHVIRGHVAQKIAEFVDEGQFDLLVTSTHGRSGLSRLLLGSVCERILRLTSCPVLTTRFEESKG